MFILVYDGQIVGKTDSPDSSLPYGYEVIECPTMPLEALVLVDGKPQARPEQPSNAHIWNGRDWYLPQQAPQNPPEALLTEAQEWDVVYGLLQEVSPIVASVIALFIAKVENDTTKRDKYAAECRAIALKAITGKSNNVR